MANKKITDATTATSVAGTDKVFLNQGGDLKQVDLNSAVANSQAVQTLNSNLVDRDIITTLPIPTKEKTYFVRLADDTFPYLYGKLQISYGSNIYEYVALYQTTGADNECYINSYLRDHWNGWKKILSQSI